MPCQPKNASTAPLTAVAATQQETVCSSSSTAAPQHTAVQAADGLWGCMRPLCSYTACRSTHAGEVVCSGSSSKAVPQHAVPMQQNRSAATAKQCIRTALAVILQKYMQLSLGNTSAKCGCQVAEADVQKQQGSASARVQAGVRLQMVRTTSAVPAMAWPLLCATVTARHGSHAAEGGLQLRSLCDARPHVRPAAHARHTAGSATHEEVV